MNAIGEYTIQETFVTDEGRRRPDVIIRLPEGRHVVIDSKLSLNQYNKFVNAANGDEKTAALKAHMYSIRQHMKSLGEKNYQRYYGRTVSISLSCLFRSSPLTSSRSKQIRRFTRKHLRKELFS
ncbi:MAG: DNA recombination protein RmuC [Bacteroidota bacterium]